ncbi:maleylpyruvate isomerase family mycothiol-dependent enzyme [Nocardia iowensis]|uniref:Maleylpyruvate isomerase family mycothiol-dependent enzyme n=1 Tax=Nocardia iowensis TaxID=204891 RepID=A0ABX8S1A7_NOCIO|nr:maleylpyruvate isomerase family mycothiol-dependent enzyme [Nocardia iowensis]QXN94415.1 maleylpyruvate isomerase family mycothiol-dependent enzyme [Nocardia iowensis]
MIDIDPFDGLAAEYQQVDQVLAALQPHEWSAPSAAAGWTVADTVLHLAQTDEFALASITGTDANIPRRGELSVDEAMDRLVAAERGGSGTELLQRWRQASAAVLANLRACPEGTRLHWVTVPLSPRTLAATRVAEHWAHLLDITEPLGLEYPDTDRLWLIARLAHRTLQYAFASAGTQGGPVRCELVGPNGDLWIFGDGNADSVIRGSAGEFCRVGAQRLKPEDTSLITQGPNAATALQLVRNYAL